MWPASARRWRFRYTVPRLMRGMTLRTRANTRSALGCSTPELRTASSTTESWRVLRRARGRSAAIAHLPQRAVRGRRVGQVGGQARAHGLGQQRARPVARMRHRERERGPGRDAPASLRLQREADVLDGRYLLRRLPPRLEGRRHAELAAHLERHVLVDADEAVQLLPEPALLLDLDEQRRRELPGSGEERVVDRELLADGVQVGDPLDPEHLLRLIPDRGAVLEQEGEPVAHRHPPGLLVGDDAAPDGVALGARPRHEPQGITRLEADLLHAEMAGGLVGDPAEAAPEVAREPALGREPHQVLGQVEDAARHARRHRAGHQARVILLEHTAAARPRHDDVVALLDERAERGQVPAGAARRTGEVAAVQRRHAAADLRRADDLDTASPENTHRCRAGFGDVELDRRGVEERDLAAPAEVRRRRLAAEPTAEAPRIAGQPAAAIDAERLLHAPAQEPVTVRPVGEPRDGGAEPPEQLGVAEEAVA